MLKRTVALGLCGAMLSLAACGSFSGDSEGGPATGVGSEQLQPGLYLATDTSDPEAEGEERCFTPEHIAAGQFAIIGPKEEGWTFATNRMSGGTIEVVGSHPSGSTMKIEGAYGKDSFTTDGVLEMKANGETHVLRSREQGRFISPTCPEIED